MDMSNWIDWDQPLWQFQTGQHVYFDRGLVTVVIKWRRLLKSFHNPHTTSSDLSRLSTTNKYFFRGSGNACNWRAHVAINSRIDPLWFGSSVSPRGDWAICVVIELTKWVVWHASAVELHVIKYLSRTWLDKSSFDWHVCFWWWWITFSKQWLYMMRQW